MAASSGLQCRDFPEELRKPTRNLRKSAGLRTLKKKFFCLFYHTSG